MKKQFFCLTAVFSLILVNDSLTQQGRIGSSIQPAASVVLKGGEQKAFSSGPAVSADLDFGRMPLYFIANQGQLDQQVAYYVQGKDKTLYFTPQGVTFVLGSLQGAGADQPTGEEEIRGRCLGDPKRSRENLERKDGKHGSSTEMSQSRWVVKLDFVEANPDVKPIADGKTEGTISYFKGRPEEWKTGLPTFSKIVYPDLWPGIDLVYYGTANRLKYEFVVHPGADPSQIRLAYRGVDGISVAGDGSLTVSTPGGGFRDDVPVAYQEVDSKRQNVPLSYRVDRKEAGERPARASDGLPSKVDVEEPFAYRFAVGDYDPARTLVLDPAVLVYCGFIGGSGNDIAYGIDVDVSGNVYIAGQTTSSEATFPVTAGPGLSIGGGIDAFIAKVNALGTGLVYCGYIGGSENDYGRDVVVDEVGNAYFTGYTYSTQSTFPVTVGPDLTHNLAVDTFVGKLDPSGTTLAYCGYIGGWGFDYGMAIEIDAPGNAYITGYNNSTNFPVTVGPDLTHNGSYDVYVAKVNSSGTGLVYCGHIGGDQDDEGTGIAVDSAGNAYVSGFAMSTESTFPVSGGPDLTYNGGSYDAFVAKVSPTGSALTYCGYIGGSGYDKGFGIAVDGAGNAYITGETNSDQTTFPVAVGPDTSYNGLVDAFVAKVNPSGSALTFCGYIGGSNNDYGQGIVLDTVGNIYLAGYGFSLQNTFPVVVGPDLTKNGKDDAFVARLNPAGPQLAYCGYVGGTEIDWAWGIAVDTAGNAYVCGQTDSSEASFPVIAGPDLTANGSYDAFVARVLYFDERIAKHAVGDFDGDGADELVADFGVNGIWKWDSGAWTQMSALNPEGMVVAEYDGNADDEIFVDLGPAGLWLLNDTVWMQWSAMNVETMAPGDVDGDGKGELVGDFGLLGMWTLDAGNWTQISGADADYVIAADTDATPGDEIIGDFGALGLWLWAPSAWTQLSGVNADFMTAGDHDIYAGADIIADFGAFGVWLKDSLGWFVQSGADAEYMITGNVKGIASDEIIADFGATGLWLWMTGSWEQLSGVNAEYLIKANMDTDTLYEFAADFGGLGLWLWDGGAWTQISSSNPEYMVSGDFDGDGLEEILADFGPLALWHWKAGAWTQISSVNPD